MKDLLLLHADFRQLLDHVLEIAGRGLVRSDALSRVNRIELNLQPAIARLKRLIVRVGKDDELEVPLQVSQRAGRIFKGRPISYGPTIFDTILVGRMDAPLLSETL